VKRQLIQLVDDLDGQVIEQGGKTLRFGIDGKSYEIDLSAENAAKLRAALEPFIRHSRQTSARPRGASRK
jgi:hypothetical protein